MGGCAERSELFLRAKGICRHTESKRLVQPVPDIVVKVVIRELRGLRRGSLDSRETRGRNVGQGSFNVAVLPVEAMQDDAVLNIVLRAVVSARNRGYRSLGHRSLGYRSLGYRSLGYRGTGRDLAGRDAGEAGRDVVRVGLFKTVVFLRTCGVVKIRIVVHGKIIGKAVHTGFAHRSNKHDAQPTGSNIRRRHAKLGKRHRHLIEEVHRRRLVSLRVEINIISRPGGHIANHTAIVDAVTAVNTHDMGRIDALAPLQNALRGFLIVLFDDVEASGIAAIDKRSVRAFIGIDNDLIDRLIRGDTGIPERAACRGFHIVADPGRAVARIHEDKERAVHVDLPESSLRQRIIITRCDNVLNVGHLPRKVQVVVIISAVQSVQVDRNLIHRVRAIDTRVVISRALRDDEVAGPVAEVAINRNGLLLAKAVRVGLVLAVKAGARLRSVSNRSGRYRNGRRALGHRSHSRPDRISFIEYRDAGRADVTGDRGRSDSPGAAGDLIRVGARCGRASAVRDRDVEILPAPGDDHGAILTADDSAVVACGVVVGVAVHGIVEVVDCGDFLACEMRAALLPRHDGRFRRCARTGEVQGRRAVTGCHDCISTIDNILAAGRSAGAFGVRIGVMAFSPIHDLVIGDASRDPVAEIRRDAATLKGFKRVVAVGAVGNGDVFRILDHLVFVALIRRSDKNLTIMVKTCILGHGFPEIAALGRKADVLRGIPADTVNPEPFQLQHISPDLILNPVVFGIQIRETDFTVCDLIAVIPAVDIAIVMPELAVLEFLRDAAVVSDLRSPLGAAGQMVCDHVDDNLDVVLRRDIAQRPQLVRRAKLVRSDMECERLVQPPPDIVAGIAGVRLCRRGLHRREACRSDLRDHRLDITVFPVEAVKDRAVLDISHEVIVTNHGRCGSRLRRINGRSRRKRDRCGRRGGSAMRSHVAVAVHLISARADGNIAGLCAFVIMENCTVISSTRNLAPVSANTLIVEDLPARPGGQVSAAFCPEMNINVVPVFGVVEIQRVFISIRLDSSAVAGHIAITVHFVVARADGQVSAAGLVPCSVVDNDTVAGIWKGAPVIADIGIIKNLPTGPFRDVGSLVNPCMDINMLPSPGIFKIKIVAAGKLLAVDNIGSFRHIGSQRGGCDLCLIGRSTRRGKA